MTIRRVFQKPDRGVELDRIFETVELDFLGYKPEVPMMAATAPTPADELMWFASHYKIGAKFTGDKHTGGYGVRLYGTYDNLARCIAEQWGSNETPRTMPYFIGMMLGSIDCEATWNNGGDKVTTRQYTVEDGVEAVVIVQHWPENVVEVVRKVEHGNMAIGELIGAVAEYELEDELRTTNNAKLNGSMAWVDGYPVITVGDGEWHKNYTVVFPDEDETITIEHCIGEY